MKLKAPFSVVKNALNDIRFMHDFNYQIPAETTEEFWEEECEINPTSWTCILYEDLLNQVLMDTFDPALQSTAAKGVKSLLAMAISLE